MAIPTDNNAIKAWADTQGFSRPLQSDDPKSARLEIQPTKANWLVRLLGWEPKLIVITKDGQKELQFRALGWKEWFSAVRGKLEGVTLPAIAKCCQENKLNTDQLKDLYAKYVGQGVGQIEANKPNAAKVDRAAALLQVVEPSAVGWNELSKIHQHAAGELLKRADVEARVTYATLPLVEEMGIENLGMLGAVSDDLIREKAKTEPAVALKLALHHMKNDVVEELCTPDLLKGLLAAKVQFTEKELSGLLWTFKNAVSNRDKVEAARVQVNIASIYLRCAPPHLITESFRKEISVLQDRILGLAKELPHVRQLANDNLNLIRDLLRLDRSPRNQA